LNYTRLSGRIPSLHAFFERAKILTVVY